MELLVFDLKGQLAHFRRPDTTATHSTYPFITRTAIRGLLGSILGLDQFQGEAWTGLKLLAPVKTRAQEMSLLGKGFLESGSTFNRPTSVELIIQPHYRIFYTGEHLSELKQKIQDKQSVYHTYLGSAFALTFPEFITSCRAENLDIASVQEQPLSTHTVVPTHVVNTIEAVDGAEYARAGGILYHYVGERKFRGTINMVYSTKGEPLVFYPKTGVYDPPVLFVRARGEVIVLW